MKVLLDTHVLIWAVEMPSKLGRKAKAALLDESVELLISPVSTLEIAQLASRGLIELSSTIEAWVQNAIEQLKLETAQLTHTVAAAAYDLGRDFHGDPADRLLVSTARSLPAIIMTSDKPILDFAGVRSLDARR